MPTPPTPTIHPAIAVAPAPSLSAAPEPGPGSEITFECHGRDVRFRFSDPTTFIPRQIIAGGGFYEQAMLDDMREHLLRYGPRGACVIDAGANIGNHTLYLAAICGARVLAIEPAAVMDDLELNASLNGVSRLITPVRVALGEREGWGEFLSPEPGEPGTTRIREADTQGPGRTLIATLDSIPLPAPPAILKIDIEGGELAALSGARALLATHRPVIYAECHGRAQFEAVADYLADPALGAYTAVARFNDDPTYKFMPTGTEAERSRALVALGRLAWFGKFQRLADLDAAKSRNDELARAVTDLTAQVRRMQAEISRLRSAT